jgi:hypothetical protein
MRSGRVLRTLMIGASSTLLALVVMVAVSPNAVAKKSAPEVLYVGSYDNVATPAAQTFSTIQAAVNAAKSGDWIFIAPGDYHEDEDASITGPNPVTNRGWYGGVLIHTNGVHLLGVNRNTVIVDGTLPDMPDEAGPCSPNADDQNYGPDDLGQNGIVAWANDVSIDNLTVCNYLNGTNSSSNSGNEIWWDGGDGSGKVGLKEYEGSYLTATSTYFQSTPDGSSNPDAGSFCNACALYGIFSSNSSVGSWNQVYANNFADSGAYIGACHQICDATIDHATFEENALGYSGTNSGGELFIKNSTFDNNKEGLDTNTALTGDPPPPQNGECPGNKDVPGSQPVAGTNPVIHSCWVFGPGNLVENNNNPNVPVAGTAGLGPTATGQTVSGGRNDVVIGNTYEGNEGYGLLFVPYPDSNLTSDGKTCKKTGGIDVSTQLGNLGVNCIYDPEGNEASGNNFIDNSTLGNVDNADLGNLLIGSHEHENCFVGNTDSATSNGQATNADVIDGDAQLASSTCGARTAKTTVLGADTDSTLLIQAECDSGLLSGSDCSSANYPTTTGVVTEPLPGASSLTAPASTDLPSMNPCTDITLSNLWCSGGHLVG